MIGKFGGGLLVSLVLAIGLAWPAWAGGVTVGQTRTDLATDLNHPAGYLIDHQPDTYWSLKPEATGGWAELLLDRPSLVYGLKISGNLAYHTELTIEYQSGDEWLPFSAAVFKTLPADGLIDLSWERIVTRAIRLRLDGGDASAGRISEVEVLGDPAEEIFHRLKPNKITAGSNSSPNAPVAFLSDGNTYTGWQTKDPSEPGEAVFEFEDSVLLENINIFFPQAGQGPVKLEAFKDNFWRQLAVITTQPAGWFRLDLKKQPVATAKIRLTVPGLSGQFGGIREVEFWGYGDFKGDRRQIIGDGQPAAIAPVANRSTAAVDSGVIKILFSSVSANLITNSLQHSIKLVNTGSQSIKLSDTELRYWYTDETKKRQAAQVYWSNIGAPNITTQLVTVDDNVDADTYLKIGFTEAAGAIAPGDYAEIKLGLNASDWSNYNQENDFSFNPSTTYIENANYTAYIGGNRIWGQEPGNRPAATHQALNLQFQKPLSGQTLGRTVADGRLKVLYQSANASPATNSIQTNLKLVNTSIYPINLADVNLQYWYSDETQKQQLAKVYWANIGASQMTTEFVKPDQGMAGADTCLVMGFSGGVLQPGAVVEMKLGFNAKDWSNYQQTNDYSFARLAPDYCENTRITATIGDELAWGVEPDAKPVDDNTDYRLELVFSGMLTEPAVVEINGTQVDLEPLLYLHGHTIYRYSLPESQLWEGSNFLRIQPFATAVTLEQAFIVCPGKDGVQPIAAGGLGDGLLLTGAGGGSGEYRLNREILLEEALVTVLDGSSPRLFAWINGGWLELSDSSRSTWGRRFRGPVTTNRLKLETWGAVGELLIKGSVTTDQAPTVRIVWPTDGEEIAVSGWPQQEVAGFVDNPRAAVDLNGVALQLSGHYFTIPFQKAGLKPGENRLTLTAQDPEGRRGSATAAFTIGKYSDLQLDQRDGLVYTAQSTFTISGSVTNPGQYQVSVADRMVSLSGNRFLTSVMLQEGLNTIKILGIDQNRIMKTFYRRVVRDSGNLRLSVQAPQDGSYLKTDTVKVHGSVSGLHPIGVTVNGNPAKVSGDRFAAIVSLQEGTHRITVTAVDAAGQKAIRQLAVHRDTKGPVIGDVTPAEGQLFATGTIQVSARITDANPVWVTINGQAVAGVGGVYQTALYLTDGERTITIQAQDPAGNTATHSVKVMVDTVAPDAFTPEADPSGWTNNPRPTIRFGTTDATSGIDHYEISLDDVTLGVFASPYLFTADLADGEHTVRVKAVDKAGNATLGTVKVSIDTVAPHPVIYALTPGNGLIGLRWAVEPDSDITHYEISRTPAFNGSSSRTLAVSELTAVEDGTGRSIVVYKDTAVQNGTTYQYRVVAIDRAGNRSRHISSFSPRDDDRIMPGMTQDTPVTAGVIRQIIPKGKTGAVMFESGGILIPDDFGYASRITIYERPASEFPGLPPATASPVVEFQLEVNDNGAWVKKSQLPQNVILSMPYDPGAVPADWDQSLLGIAFFSAADGVWRYDRGAFVDEQQHRVFLEVSHLSPHVVGVNPVVDDFSEKYGITAEAYDQSKKTIRVEESSGNLAARFVDVSLPTPGLLTFGVTRIYNTQRAEVDQIERSLVRDKTFSMVLEGNSQNGSLITKVNDLTEDQGFATFGRGWRLNLPYISARGYFYDFDNRAQEIGEVWEEENGWRGEYHGLHEFTAERIDDDQLLLSLKNGIKMTFERTTWEVSINDKIVVYQQGRVIKIEDTVNQYAQEIAYLDSDPQYVRVGRIKDSLNRELIFDYDGTGIAAVTLQCPGEQPQRVLEYTYDPAKVELKTAANQLTGQTDVYDYELKTVRRGKKVKGWGFGIFGGINYGDGDYEANISGLYFALMDMSSKKEYHVWVLKQITDERQRREVFEYETHYIENRLKARTFGFISYSSTKYRSFYDVFVVKRRYQQAGDEIRHQYGYDYVFAKEDIEADDSDFSLRLTKSIFHTGEARVEHYFEEIGGDNSLVSKETYLGRAFNGVLVEREKFGYLDYGKDAVDEIWRINRYEHWRNGKTVRETYQYDNWGNIIHKTSSGGDPDSTTDDSEEWFGYANADSAGIGAPGAQASPYSSAPPAILHDRLLHHVALIHTPAADDGNAGSYLKETAYQYDALGRLTHQAVWDQREWLETRYVYDAGAAHPREVIDPLRHSVYFTYDRYGNMTKTEQSVADADGNSRTIHTEWGFDPVWGWKLWEKDGRGHTTVYRYAKPDGALDYRGRVWEEELPDDDDPISWTPASGTARTGNPVIRTIYDDAKLTKTVIDALNRKTVNQYDAFGTLATVTKYRRSDAGSEEPYAVTEVTYNPYGKLETLTDPRGLVTRFEYDDLGNVTRMIHPDNTVKTFSYDFAAGRMITRNERGYGSAVYKDGLGRLIRQEVEDDFHFYQTVSQVSYDGAGRAVTSVDPAGSETLTLYDGLGRQLGVILPPETLWENGVAAAIRPRIDYEYNALGQKTAEIKHLAGGVPHRAEYRYDALGRVIRSETSYTDDSGEVKPVVTKTYYDENGNPVRVVDPNEAGLSAAEQKGTTSTYSAANRLLTETDPAGNTTRYSYDAAGNRLSVTDPRGNSGKYPGDFTTGFEYDDLNRLVARYLPAAPGETEKPVIRYQYDRQGNLLEQTEPDGGKTVYTYNSRNQKATIVREGADRSYVTRFKYDEAGNETEVEDALGNRTLKAYDSLNRLVKITYPEGNTEQFEYDLRNNKTGSVDGRHLRTEYTYDRYNRLTQVKDSANGITGYGYDRNGNLTQAVNALGHATRYRYDQLGRLVAEEDSLGYIQQYAYDAKGNRIFSLDKNGSIARYDYAPNHWLTTIRLSNGGRTQVIEYGYDEAGTRKETRSDGVTTRYNLFDGEYRPDPAGRIRRETKTVDGKTFTVDYAYDSAGRTTGIKYPTGRWVNYQYNSIDELVKVPGYVEAPPVYDQRGRLTGMKTANNVNAESRYDRNGRLQSLNYSQTAAILKEYSYGYDGADNMVRKNGDAFEYDLLNQLIYANINGRFEVDPAGERQTMGVVREDYTGQRALDFNVDSAELIELDYAAGSIGVDLGITVPVTRVRLTPQSPVHRVEGGALRVYGSQDNATYTRVHDWEADRRDDGGLEISFAQPLELRYIKIRSLFDNRGKAFQWVDGAQFKNTPDALMKVYYQVSASQERYAYDALGNRMSETITKGYDQTYPYTYYPNSSRLASNGKYRFVYDPNGNLIQKTSVTGETVWDYQYDLLNRLVKVSQNGAAVAEYRYDEAGLRLKKQSPAGTTYYVFDTVGNLLYEQENREYREYIYVLGKHLARVDGNLDNANETRKYFYHTDHLGSTVAVTDEAGETVWSGEYLPFGGKHSTKGELEHVTKFTGKDLDEDTGLYYFNARWYDQEIGRFISEDSAKDGVNWYIYCSNRPLNRIDPTGWYDLDALNDQWKNDIAGFGFSAHTPLDTLSLASGIVWGFGEDLYGMAKLASEFSPLNLLGKPWEMLNRYQDLAVAEYKLVDTFLSGSKEDRDQIIDAVKQQLGEMAIVPFKNVAYGFTHYDEMSLSEKFELGKDVYRAGSNLLMAYGAIKSLAGVGNKFAAKLSGSMDDLGLVYKGAGKTGEQVLSRVKSYEQARNKALDIVGDLGADSKAYVGRLGTGEGKIVGMQSADGKVRWRLDYDPQKGLHINVEDFRTGKGPNAIKIAIPFEGDMNMIESLLRHLNK